MSSSSPVPENFLLRLGKTIWDAVVGLYRHDAITSASVISFALIFAIFPFVILVVLSATTLLGEDFAMQVEADLLEALPDHVAATIEPELDSVLGARLSSGLFTAGILVILFTVSSLVETIRAALNTAYRIEETRTILRRRAGSLILVLVTAAGLILIAGTQVLLPLALPYLTRFLPAEFPLAATLENASVIVTPAVLVLLTLSMHVWLPVRSLRVLSVLPGVLVTVLLWILTTGLFGFYLEQFSTFGATYASLAGVFASMIFFEIGGLALIFGAELNRALAVHFAPQSLFLSSA